MATTSCSKCGKTFTKPTQTGAEQALRMHTGRTHSGIIKSPVSGAGRLRYSRKAAEPIQVVAEAPGNGERVKRKYTKRQPEGVEVRVNLCPVCGCDIQAVAMGIAMGRKFRKQ